VIAIPQFAVMKFQKEAFMALFRKLFLPALAGLMLLGTLSACEKEGPMERAGEKIDESVERAGDKVERATDK
jgi:hypothetical protein